MLQLDNQKGKEVSTVSASVSFSKCQFSKDDPFFPLKNVIVLLWSRSAYVEFMRKEAAEHALSLNGTSFMSRILKVNQFNCVIVITSTSNLQSAELKFHLLSNIGPGPEIQL